MEKLSKLHRSRNHRMIAGVLGGFAEYLGWSPMLVRILFVTIIAFTAVTLPPSVLVYFILWIVMPNATAASYKKSA